MHQINFRFLVLRNVGHFNRRHRQFAGTYRVASRVLSRPANEIETGTHAPNIIVTGASRVEEVTCSLSRDWIRQLVMFVMLNGTIRRGDSRSKVSVANLLLIVESPPSSYSTSEDEKSLFQWPQKPVESGKASSGPLAKF